MWKTVLALLVTIVVIPVLAFRFDDPLSSMQSGTLLHLVIIYLVAALLCFAVSTLSNNYSQVDKLWSILPIVYLWVVAAESAFEPRLLLMALLVTAWGIRLSYNFARRGGYSIRFWSGEEDYRWSVLRAKPEFAASWKWVLFNLFFISLYQMGLILLMTLPAVRSMDGRPLSLWDAVLALVLLTFIVIETLADQQQWNYHRKKRRLRESGAELPEKYREGYIHTGLWGIVRHPNYASEQAIWIVFYFLSVVASGQWLNWSVMGAILLVLLFWGSSNFSESISAGKYPDYSEYVRKVPRFIPFIKSGSAEIQAEGQEITSPRGTDGRN
jgi:steroid 5-alpha reductase family enzyme